MVYGSKDEWISIEAEVILETSKAIRIFDGKTYTWLPKSQLEDWPDLGKFGEVLLTEWIAEEKGLI